MIWLPHVNGQTLAGGRSNGSNFAWGPSKIQDSDQLNERNFASNIHQHHLPSFGSIIFLSSGLELECERVVE